MSCLQNDFITDDQEFVAAAEQQGVELIDVRKNNFTTIARRQDFEEVFSTYRGA